ncbi:type II toxin-antitoxin system RelE/ParE family toxin [Pantoea cypripedii]|uniref:type II toxin-antitoxin system RelE/ParE family toxin n=1 Tax=Pantoea cypripedii TaxID=55209 RepID=UPI002FC7DC08
MRMDNLLRLFVEWSYNKERKKSGITDFQLRQLVVELLADPKDGSLGGGVYKKRVALQAGTRGGARTIIIYHQGDRVYFLDGWEKKDVPKSGPEIPPNVLNFYKLQSRMFKSKTENQIKTDLENKVYIEMAKAEVEKKYD